MLDTEHPETIVSSEWDGKRRKLVACICDYCHIRFFVPRHARHMFCSVPCTNESRKRRVAKVCDHCGVSFDRVLTKVSNSKSGLQFCSRLCKDTAQRLEGNKLLHPPHYGNGSNPNREYLIRVRGHKCQSCLRCEWMGSPIPLETHHVDGDSRNNNLTNLLLLCPNCHAQTPNYCSLNMGKGRKSRGQIRGRSSG